MQHRSVSDLRARKERLAAAILEKQKREERARQADPYIGLIRFIRYFWPIVEPSRPLIEGWPLEAVCEHLMATFRGDIKRLVISVPPGFMKSLAANVFFCAWIWGPGDSPETRFIAASYSQSLTVRDNVRFRNIIMSEEYQELWGTVFQPSTAQFNIVQVGNDKTGWKLATSVGGVSTGARGDFFIVDDGNSVKEAESEAIRESTNQWYSEVVPTRLNDAENGVIINIQQRTHENDITGLIIDRDLGYDMLCIPMEFETSRPRIPTKIGWLDPRTEDGELAWPSRFSRKAVTDLKKVMGPYAVSGQFQQNPAPRGGGVIQRDWWQLWEESAFPVCEYKWASADTAYTEKEENDPSAMVVLGLFRYRGQHSVILMDAWRKRLEMHVPVRWVDDRRETERLARVKNWQRISENYYAANLAEGCPEVLCHPDYGPWATYIATGENGSDRWPNECTPAYNARTQEKWGLCEWMANSCRRFKVNKLIIEGKASGLSVAQELRRLHGTEGWDIETTTPSGDKMARLYAVQSLFSSGLIYAPDREWAQMVIDEVSSFPRGKYKDLTDAVSQGLKHVRENGLLLRPEERHFVETEAAQYRPPSKPLYEV